MAAFRIPVSLATIAVIFHTTLTIADAQSIDISRSVLTQHNDSQRTGWYQAETQLAPSTVKPTTFGELYRLHVSGMISAQPLYVHGVNIGGVQRNVLYVATNENHIYGFAIDNPGDTSPPQLSPLITADFSGSALLPGMLPAPPGVAVLPFTCGQTWWKAGITSTPVIDPTTGTMFVVYRTGPTPGLIDKTKPATAKGNYALGAQFWLVALDIRTLKPVQQAVEIKDPGNRFAADMELNRPALLLANGTVYVAFGGAVCDQGGDPYLHTQTGHGWVFAFDASNISSPPAAFNTTPTTSLGGIWQSGNGLSALGDSVFAFTGNNGADGDSQNKPEYAESLIKLTLTKSSSGLRTFATPTPAMRPGNWYRLDLGDTDLASGGPVVLPNHRIVGGGKQGVLYVVDPDSLRQTQPAFQAFYNTWHPETDVCQYDAMQMNGPNIHGSPVVWHPGGVNYALFYGMPEKEYLKGFRAYDNGQVDSSPDLTTIESGYRSPDKMPGGFLSISSNAGKDGIVWALVSRDYGRNRDATYNTVPGRLLAFDALTLRALWSDDAAPGVNFVKFVPPTIADGKVFRVSYDGEVAKDGSTAGMVVVYGAKASQGTPLPSIPVPAKRLVTAGWSPQTNASEDMQAQLLYLFTSAADGEVISTFFSAYTPNTPKNAGCVNAWRGWFPVSDTRPTTRGLSPITAVWRPVAKTAAWSPGTNHLDFFMVADDGTVKSGFVEDTVDIKDMNGKDTKKYKYSWPINWFGVTAHPETGKTVPSEAVTAVWRDGKPDHLDLFITGTDGIVKSTFFENGKWQPGWFQASLDAGKAAVGQPITAVWRPGGVGHLDLFMVADDGTVKSAYFENNKWQSGWFGVPIHPETGKAAPGQPVTAVWRDANHLDLFITGTDGIVRSTFFENGKWQPGWFQAGQIVGKAAVGQPITAVWRPGGGHLDLFMVADDGTVKSTFFENGKWSPTGWFGVTANPESGKAAPGQSVTAVWSSATHLDLFINGADGHVRSTFFDTGKWQPGWFLL